MVSIYSFFFGFSKDRNLEFVLLGYYQVIGIRKRKNEIFIICLNKIYCDEQNFMNRIFYYVYKFYCLVNFYFSR